MSSLKIDAAANWSEKEARRIFAAWKRSGKTAGAFAAEHGFHRQRLFYWKDRLASDAKQAIKFAPAVLHNARSAVRIVVGPTSIEIDAAAVAPEWLASLIVRLSERACS